MRTNMKLQYIELVATQKYYLFVFPEIADDRR